MLEGSQKRKPFESLSLENPKALLWMTALTPGYGFPFEKASTIDGI